MAILIFANQRLNEQSDENILEALFTNNELGESEDFNYSTTEPFIAELKVDRNEPCPYCSGKIIKNAAYNKVTFFLIGWRIWLKQ
ncbi:hypothetical protein [Colwellia sp. UCD-KL20]|uniref:hypothetical protein n=1 Tax=Colwellia sp. UCD-KL20 TaxID=1917165 RepID=UPI0009703740|nr:hypothetical protein [Colwellia sp. UCD-KL20]